MIKSWSRVFTAFIGDGYIASAFFAALRLPLFRSDCQWQAGLRHRHVRFAHDHPSSLRPIFRCIAFIEGKETTEQLVGLSLTAAIGLGLVAIMNFAALDLLHDRDEEYQQ
jgi:hypothetical protein